MDSNSTVVNAVDAETTPVEPVKQRISLSPTTIPSRRSASHLLLGRPSARAFSATVAKVEPRKTFVLRGTPKRLFSSVVAPGATPQ
jgi:hypothetical protein